jgi:hypothetical protein
VAAGSGPPPDWLTALFAEAAVRATWMRSRRERGALEEEHRLLLLRDTVERRLLAEERIPPGHDAELIATDIAFTASKELVRGCGPVCGPRRRCAASCGDGGAVLGRCRSG